jgi:hypothetical protein
MKSIVTTLGLLISLATASIASGSWSAPIYLGSGGVNQIQNSYVTWGTGDFQEVSDGGGSLAPPLGVCGTMGSFQITYL